MSRKSVSNSNREKALIECMVERIDESSHKFLKNMSVEVAEHLKLMDFDSLSARITKTKTDLSTGKYPAIFVSAGNDISVDNWQTTIGPEHRKDDVLNSYITSTLKKYNDKNVKYGYNDLPYRLFRIAELYESSDIDIEKRLDIYKSGVKKYAELMKTDKDIEKYMKEWGFDKINEKIDNPDPACDEKFVKKGVCPIDFYYGPHDVVRQRDDVDVSKLHMESVVDYFLDDNACYKHNHLRQYILGNSKDTSLFKPINKYFHINPSISSMHDKFPEITWDPNMNDVFIKCLLTHIFNQINRPLFPLRIYIDDRYVNMLENPHVSKYDYVPKKELDNMTYLGCFLIPLYTYYFEHTIHDTRKRYYIEPFMSVNGSTTIEDEFRKDISKSKTGYDEDYYIQRINGMIFDLIDGHPSDKLLITMNSVQDSSHKQKDTFRITRRQIRRTVMIYNFHLFKKDNKYIMINYRSNIIEPEFILERFKFLYVELSQIIYMIKNIYKLPTFRLHRYEKSNIFYFSPYYDGTYTDSYGITHENDFSAKKTELISRLSDHGNIINPNERLNITTKSLGQFYEKLTPYDVLIDSQRGNSLYIDPVRLNGGRKYGINRHKSKKITQRLIYKRTIKCN